MTPAEQSLCSALGRTPQHPSGRISKEEFVQRFPAAVINGALSTELLREAVRERSSTDLGCALTIGFMFGFAPEQSEILAPLIEADWHKSHENIVHALDDIGRHDRNVLDALYKATQWVPKYLGYDDTRALASKAIWAIGKFSSPESDRYLRELASSDDPILREDAQEQVERRGIKQSRQS
jgi:hypothetical protein